MIVRNILEFILYYAVYFLLFSAAIDIFYPSVGNSVSYFIAFVSALTSTIIDALDDRKNT